MDFEESYFNVPKSVFNEDLNIFEKSICIYLCYVKEKGIDIFPSHKDIADHCKMSKRQAINTVKSLGEKRKLIIKHIGKSAEDIKVYLMAKDLKGNGLGNNICPWCNGKSIILQEHHFPIPKEKGGTETVKICPTCHYEFHALVNEKVFELDFSM